MTTFIAFTSALIDFLALSPFGWFCALALLYFGISFFWTLFNKE